MGPTKVESVQKLMQVASHKVRKKCTKKEKAAPKTIGFDLSQWLSAQLFRTLSSTVRLVIGFVKYPTAN
jgi:hypothetical protein